MTACLRTDNDHETYMYYWNYDKDTNRHWLVCFSVSEEQHVPHDLAYDIDCTHETLEVYDTGVIVHDVGYNLWNKLMRKWFPDDELEFITFGDLLREHRRSL